MKRILFLIALLLIAGGVQAANVDTDVA